MTFLQKLRGSYAVRLVLALLVSALLSAMQPRLGGGALLALCLLLAWVAARDGALRKRHVAARIAVWFFIALFAVSGFLGLFQLTGTGDFLQSYVSQADASDADAASAAG